MEINQTCPSCKETWYSQVAFCPYCGKKITTNRDVEANAEERDTVTSQEAVLKQEIDSESVQERQVPPREAAEVAPPSTEVPLATTNNDSAVPDEHLHTLASAEPAGGAQCRDDKRKDSQEVSPEGKDIGQEKPIIAARRKKMMIVMTAAMALGLGGYWTITSNTGGDACETALSLAAAHLGASDLSAARAQAIAAVATCMGPAQARAQDLTNRVEQKIVEQDACDKSIRQISGLVAERRLQSAGQNLNRLDTWCLQQNRAQDLRNQIESGQHAAKEDEAEVRRLLRRGDLETANETIARIVAVNREHPGLPALRQEIQAALRNRATAHQSSPVATPALVEVRPSNTAPAANATRREQAELAKGFLRDAENALAQMRFDAAKTFVESALRIDPQNPEAAVLNRKIRERELQYLRDETSIR